MKRTKLSAVSQDNLRNTSSHWKPYNWQADLAGVFKHRWIWMCSSYLFVYRCGFCSNRRVGYLKQITASNAGFISVYCITNWRIMSPMDLASERLRYSSAQHPSFIVHNCLQLTPHTTVAYICTKLLKVCAYIVSHFGRMLLIHLLQQWPWHSHWSGS